MSTLRTLTLVSALVLVTSLLAFTPAADAREAACTSLAMDGCDALVCADTNLDGQFQWNECEPHACTCDPQPEPW